VEHHCFAYLRGEGDFLPAAAAEAIVDIVYRGLQVQAVASSAENLIRRFDQIADRMEANLLGQR
jgi:hypothetical protein